MIKDMDYYENFDLEKAASLLHDISLERRRVSEIFADAKMAVAVRCMNAPIAEKDVLRFLGKPDRIRKFVDREVWDYDFEDVYGDLQYESSTPFAIVGGSCIGIDVANRTK